MHHTQAKSAGAANSTNHKITAPAPANSSNNHQGEGHAKKARLTSAAAQAAAATNSNNESAASSAALLAAKAAAEEWQAKCAKLQRKLQDKDEQLKAVTGNKTILHTALQQALTKTREELRTLREATASKTEKVNLVLEETLRWKFEQKAKELMSTLSADGNR